MNSENFTKIDFYRYSPVGGPVSAEESLAAAGPLQPEKAALLAYTPVECAFALWDGARIVHLDGTVPVSDIFEFYCFTADWQLHWFENGSSGRGTAVLTSEKSLAVPRGTQETKLENCLLLRGQRYLLWGRKTAGGATLYDRRVGALPLPSATDGVNAYLTYNEIFRAADKYGNISFLMQRLTGIA